jgi:hypothetical protein
MDDGPREKFKREHPRAALFDVKLHPPLASGAWPSRGSECPPQLPIVVMPSKALGARTKSTIGGSSSPSRIFKPAQPFGREALASICGRSGVPLDTVKRAGCRK